MILSTNLNPITPSPFYILFYYPNYYSYDHSFSNPLIIDFLPMRILIRILQWLLKFKHLNTKVLCFHDLATAQLCKLIFSHSSTRTGLLSQRQSCSSLSFLAPRLCKCCSSVDIFPRPWAGCPTPRVLQDTVQVSLFPVILDVSQ